MERQITGFGDTVTSMEENGKFFIMKNYGEGKPRGARRTYTYVKVDKEEYLARLKQLAESIANCPGVRLADIVEDALKEYPLEEIERIESDINEEIKEATVESRRPEIKTKPGHCCEIKIGRRNCFVVRN